MGKNLIIESVSKESIPLIAGRYRKKEFRYFEFYFTSRIGGFSQGQFFSLNLSQKVGDRPEDVESNRSKLFKALDLPADNLAAPEQVHGKIVKIIKKDDGAYMANGSDGLITTLSRKPLMALFADCIPVILFDKNLKAGGVVHAGWRGTFAKIVSSAIEVMSKNYINPRDLCAVVGPGIGPCCFQVGPELLEKFTEYTEAFRIYKNKRYLDLKRINRTQMMESGMLKSNIYDVKICTACDANYFSHRRDNGKTGRQAAILIFRDK